MTNQRDICFITSSDGVQIATAKYGSGPLLLKADTWLTHIEHAPAGTMHASLIDEFSRTNTYVERFNRTVRYEWLSQYYWSSIEEVQDFTTQWMWFYNHDRPNMALGGFTPKQHLVMAA